MINPILIVLFFLFSYFFCAAFSDDLETLFISTLLVTFAALIIQSELKSKSYFSPLNLYAGLVILHFGLPGIAYSLGVDLIAYSPNSNFISTTLMYVLLNLFVLTIANIVSNNKRTKIKINYLWTDSNVKIIIFFFLVIGVITRLYLISNNSYFQIYRGSEYNLTGNALLSFFMLFERLPFYALIIIFIHRFSSNTNSKFWINASYALIAFEILYWFPAGRKEEIISSLMYPFIISVIFLNKFPSKKKLFFSSLFIISIFPLTRFMRIGLFAISLSAGSITNINDIINVIPEAINYGQHLSQYNNDKNYSNLNRISLLESASAAVRLSEEKGYKYGESYYSIFYSFIPRFIWPNKPKSTSGIEFGNESGIVGKNSTSSISVTYLGESFYNFGFFGVFITLIVFLLMNYLYRLAFFRGNPVLLLVFIMALKPYIYFGGELSPYFTGYLKTLIMFLPVFLFLNYNKIKNINVRI